MRNLAININSNLLIIFHELIKLAKSSDGYICVSGKYLSYYCIYSLKY